MGSPAGAQSSTTKKEAELLLQKAAEAADLQASDTPPFHLVAKVHYSIGKQTFDGKYELLWASPDRFRENFKMGTTGEEEIALGDKLYVLRNTDAPSLPLWSVRESLKSVRRFFEEAAKDVGKVHPAETNKNQQICVDSYGTFTETQTCFDGATRRTVSLGYGLYPSERTIHSDEIKRIFKLELNDFLTLGDKCFPSHLTRHNLDEMLEIAIETLAEVRTFADGLFAPPPGIAARDWCPSPAKAGVLQMDRGSLSKVDPPGSLFAYYVYVGRDGHVVKSVPIRQGGWYVDVRMAERLRMAHFPIRSCEGKPIEYETVVEAPIRLRLLH